MEHALSLVPSVVAALIARGATPQDAEDAADTMVERSPKCRATNPRAFRAWANKTAYNAHVDLLRERLPIDAAARMIATERTVESDTGEVTTEKVYRAGKARATMRAILRLPERPREALLLYVDGASVQQIADKQHTSYKAAEHRIARAKTTVQERVKATYGGLAALVRPRGRVAAVAAVGVAVLSGLGLLVQVRPLPPRQVAERPGQVVRPRLTPTVAPSPPSPRPASTRAAVAVAVRPGAVAVSLRPTQTHDGLRPASPPEQAPQLNQPPPRDRDDGLAESVMYCVEHLEVPDVPPKYLGCRPSE